jgi:hypothetical protein
MADTRLRTDADMLSSRPVPSVSDRVSSPENPALVAQANLEVSQAVAGVGDKLAEEAEILGKRIDRSEVAHAESVLFEGALAAGREVEDIEDHTTWEQEYTDRVKSVAQQAMKGITNPDLLGEFQSSSNKFAAKGAERTRLLAKQRGHEVSRGKLIEDTESLKETIYKAGTRTERTAAFTTANEAISSAVTRGDITVREAVLMKNKFMTETSEGLIATMTPEVALTALKNGLSEKDGKMTFSDTGTFVDFISPERRAVMIKNLRKMDREDKDRAKSQIISDSIFSVGGTRTEALKNAYDTNSAYYKSLNMTPAETARVRDSVVARINRRYDEIDAEKKAVADAKDDDQESAFEMARAMVVKGKGAITIAHLPDSLLARLSAQDTSALEVLSARYRNSQGVQANPEGNAAYQTIMAMGRDEFKKLKMSEVQTKYEKVFTTRQMENVAAKISSARTADDNEVARLERTRANVAMAGQTSDTMLRGILGNKAFNAKQNSALRAQAKFEMEEFAETFLAENNRVPTKTEMNKHAASLLLQGRVDLDWAKDPKRVRFQVLGTDAEQDFYLRTQKEDIPRIALATGLPEAALLDVLKTFDNAEDVNTRSIIAATAIPRKYLSAVIAKAKEKEPPAYSAKTFNEFIRRGVGPVGDVFDPELADENPRQGWHSL